MAKAFLNTSAIDSPASDEDEPLQTQSNGGKRSRVSKPIHRLGDSSSEDDGDSDDAVDQLR